MEEPQRKSLQKKGLLYSKSICIHECKLIDLWDLKKKCRGDLSYTTAASRCAVSVKSHTASVSATYTSLYWQGSEMGSGCQDADL